MKYMCVCRVINWVNSNSNGPTVESPRQRWCMATGSVEGWRGGGVEGGEAEGERGAGSGLTITDY